MVIYMVRTILKRPWILLVVLKSPWIWLRSLKSFWFLYKIWKIPWNSQPCLRQTPFSLKLDYFADENLAHPRCKNVKKLTGNVKTFLWMNNYVFLYFKCYVFTLDVISSHNQSFCKVLLQKVVQSMWSSMAAEVKVVNDSAIMCFSQKGDQRRLKNADLLNKS